MNSTAVYEDNESEILNSITSNGHGQPMASQDKIKALKQLTFRLLREVQSIGEVQTLDLEGGLDFYAEVSRFEIDLIKRALLQTGGHQGRAARLLNLKVTTLNSKLKHYNIRLNGFANGYPQIDSAETLQHA